MLAMTTEERERGVGRERERELTSVLSTVGRHLRVTGGRERIEGRRERFAQTTRKDRLLWWGKRESNHLVPESYRQ